MIRQLFFCWFSFLIRSPFFSGFSSFFGKFRRCILFFTVCFDTPDIKLVSLFVNKVFLNPHHQAKWSVSCFHWIPQLTLAVVNEPGNIAVKSYEIVMALHLLICTNTSARNVSVKNYAAAYQQSDDVTSDIQRPHV